jgi:hypothetical protein
MWLRFALVASAATPIIHCAVLLASGQDAVRDPISELSRQRWGDLHTLGLMLFGAAQVALVVALARLDRGRAWPWGRAFLGAGGAALFFIAVYFAKAGQDSLRGPEANDPLWIVASLVGLAMGALQPGFSRLSRWLGRFNGVCLGIWLLLVPLILLVDEAWLGAYERLVGAVYAAWLIGVASVLLRSRGMKSAGR